MAVEIPLFDVPFKAAADLTAKQYYALEITAADTVNVCGAATDRVIGVLQNTPNTNQAASVRVHGITKAVSDGSGTAIAAGDYVGPNSSGKMVKKATADYSVAGIALSASSADGTVISVLLTPGAWFRTAAG
jgi:hypothetical protein